MWSGNASACSAGEPHRWPAAAGLPAMRKRKRMVRCCNAAVEKALHSGLVGNDDSHWSLVRKGEMKRGEIKMVPRRSRHMLSILLSNHGYHLLFKLSASDIQYAKSKCIKM